MAPSSMVINVNYSFGVGSEHGNGIGYEILKRIGGVDTEVVALDNIGNSVSNEVTGIAVAQGDQLFFRFDTCGDPGGDISRADITIKGMPGLAARATSSLPSGGTIEAGSDFTFKVQATGAEHSDPGLAMG